MIDRKIGAAAAVMVHRGEHKALDSDQKNKMEYKWQK